MEISSDPIQTYPPPPTLISLVKIGDTFLCPWVQVSLAHQTNSRGQHFRRPDKGSELPPALLTTYNFLSINAHFNFS